MSTTKYLISMAAMIIAAGITASAAVATDGAEVGKWTQDYDAALKLAKEKNLPVIVNFTGSDWCGWCKLMERQVFSKNQWEKWAKDNVVLAFINFPQDKSLVPEKYVKRNNDLAAKFKIRGYPTYIILAADGETILGTAGASRDADPKKFIASLPIPNQTKHDAQKQTPTK